MSEKNNHWLLTKFKDKIEILPHKYPEYVEEFCREKQILMNNTPSIRRMLSWDDISEKYSISYDNIKIEEHIGGFLIKSKITNSKYLIIDMGFNLPILKVPTDLFIDNCFDFAWANGFLGTTIFSEDGKFFMEFTDNSDSLLYSNFLIVPAD